VNAFIQKHADSVIGMVSGFDRLVLRGTIRSMAYAQGMKHYLDRTGVLLKDFGDYAEGVTKRVKAAVLEGAERQKRPVIYLPSGKTSKEELARQIATRDRITNGLICVLTSVESCPSFEIFRNRDAKKLELRPRFRKCLHLYQYLVHEVFGLINVRIQSWLPLSIQVCLNGREWLARELSRRRSAFTQADNCFTWLSNPALAQRLMNEQLEADWPAVLTALARSINPLHDELFRPWPMDYYWSAYQVEWATDIAFKDSQALAGIYPGLVHHAMRHFKSEDVMRFLGQKLHGNFTGEVTTSYKVRPEGVRVKHWVRGNSLKMYDKARSILRVETTTARTSDFKVLRPPHDEPRGELAWRPMRKGIADLHRRAMVSQRSNERYLDALAAVEDTTPCSRLFDSVALPVVDAGRRFRALRLGDPDDVALLQAISRGEFAISGFRNRDLRGLLYPPPASTTDERRLSGRVSRQLRLLRAHGIIRKIPKTHRYQLTDRGHLLTAVLRATRDADVKQLIQKAA